MVWVVVKNEFFEQRLELSFYKGFTGHITQNKNKL